MVTPVTRYDNSKSVREDLSDIIFNISPTTTPFMSNVGRDNAENTYHEWSTDILAAPDANNYAIEGADATDPDNTTAMTQNRVGNYTQISQKVISVSGTSGAVDTAGMKTVEAYLNYGVVWQ